MINVDRTKYESIPRIIGFIGYCFSWSGWISVDNCCFTHQGYWKMSCKACQNPHFYC
jgi:hypothetical protein